MTMDSCGKRGFGLCPERHLRLKHVEKVEESILFGKCEK